MIYKQISDEKLMSHLQSGDEQAFNELYQRYSGIMYGYFWRMLYQEKTIAQDFTQQLFMKIIENKSRFDSNYKFLTWIYTIASNMIKNEYRAKQRRKGRLEMTKQWYKDDSMKFIERMDQDMRSRDLQIAIESLEEKQKQCFILKHQEGLSIKEISEVLQCPEGTVKSRLFYSLRALSTRLNKVRYT